MRSVLETFKGLTVYKKILVIATIISTIALAVAIPVYAWFSNQRKAAEMFKVKCPNSLYINAAHREDQVNFALGGIDVNEPQLNADGSIKTVNNDPNGSPIFITEKRYVFSVSGSSTEIFTLQLAHTNNNLFTYKIYEATETQTKPDTGVYVEYTATGEHTENTMVFTGDNVTKDTPLYYVKGAEITNALADVDNAGYMNMPEGASTANGPGQNSPEYTITYAGNTNVQAHAVPSYWQATIDSNQGANKQFCRYFILEVTWNYEVQSTTQTTKETDLVYLSVDRVS